MHPGRFVLGTGRVEGEELAARLRQDHPVLTEVLRCGFEVPEVTYPYGAPGMRFTMPGEPVPWNQSIAMPRLSDEPDMLFDAMLAMIEALPKQPLATHYRAIFDWLADELGRDAWVERSAGSIEFCGELHACFREARQCTCIAAGLEFVRANPLGEAIDVEAFLGDMAPVVKAMELERASLVNSEKMDVVETNWKLAMDTFCESYHVPAVHGRSLGDQVVPQVTIDDLFGIHGRYIGPGKHLAELVGKPVSEWPSSNYSGVHCIFPNTTFTYTDSIDGETPVFTLFRLFPGREIGQTEVLFSTFKPLRSVPKDDAGFEKLHDELHWVVKNEGFATAANTWQRLRHAPPDMMLVFGGHESILQSYHRELGKRAGMPLNESSRTREAMD